MEIKNKEMSSGLLRQRRNFIGISIFLPLYLLSGVTIDKISFFGNAVTVKSQTFLTGSLFLLFLYFMLRYYQYFIEEDNVKYYKKHIEEKIKDSMSDFLEGRVKSKIDGYNKKYLFIRLPSEYTNSQKFDTAGLPNQKIKRVNPFIKNFLVIVRVSDEISEIRKQKDKAVDEKVQALTEWFKSSPAWNQCYRITNHEKLPEMFQADIKFNYFELMYIRMKTWGHFLIHTSSITNYYFPFVIACISTIFIVYWFITQICKNV